MLSSARAHRTGVILLAGLVCGCQPAQLGAAPALRALPSGDRVELTLGEGATLGFVVVPGGSFTMGSPDGVGYEYEHPAHEVAVETFWMAEVEVTRALFATQGGQVAQAIVQGGPKNLSLERPIDAVSWCEALVFANHLSSLHPGAQPVYDVQDCERDGAVRWNREIHGFRLPTEAEWEYAARAGTTTLWWTGDDPDALSDAAWYAERGSLGIHEVGTKRANPWGLYDVHGNVWEWTWDAWAPYGQPGGADPGVRVTRGGGAWFVADMARSAFRYPRQRHARVAGQGLRLVLDAEAVAR